MEVVEILELHKTAHNKVKANVQKYDTHGQLRLVNLTPTSHGKKIAVTGTENNRTWQRYSRPSCVFFQTAVWTALIGDKVNRHHSRTVVVGP